MRAGGDHHGPLAPGAHDRRERGDRALHHAHAALAATAIVVELGEPWTDYPGESIEADTLRMNAWIEAAHRRDARAVLLGAQALQDAAAGREKPY
jgi:hypothetical protein